MKKFFQYLLLIVLFSFSGVILTHKEQSRTFFQNVKRTYIDRPCSKPITYAIGNVDPRFHISPADFQKTVLSAETIWENPIGRNLFQYDPNSNFKINLIYDDRQERTQESQKLENQLGTLENSHEEIIGQYNNLSAAYKKRLDSYNKAVAQYEKSLADYNQEVDLWNAKGGATPEVFSQLKKEKKDLENTFAQLEIERKAVNALIGQTNDLAEKEKSVVNNYNTSLSSYKNKYGEPSEFDKGVYDGKSINVYQFNQKDDLEMTIVHELGHALGIDHLGNPQSVMYYLMGEQDMENPHLSPEDISALKDICMINSAE